MSDVTQNAAVYFVDRHADGAYRDKAAFREASGAQRSISYAELAHETGRVAHLFERHEFESRRSCRDARSRPDRISRHILGRPESRRHTRSRSIRCWRPTCTTRSCATAAPARFSYRANCCLSWRRSSRDHPYLRKVFVIGGEAPAGALSFEKELARLRKPSAGRGVRRRVRFLALFVRIDRPAQGRAPRSLQPEISPPTPMARRC